MASLMSLFAASTTPADQSLMPSLAPSEFDRIVPRDGPAPLFEEVVITTYTPLWENQIFLIIMVIIGICLLVALAFFIGKRQSQQCRNDYAMFKREQAERAYMRSGLFDAASDITRVSSMYNLRNQRRRR